MKGGWTHPKDIDPAWEYWTPDPELEDAGLAGTEARARSFDCLADESSPRAKQHGRNAGLRFGVGDPDRMKWFPTKWRAEDCRPRAERLVECEKCRRLFVAARRKRCDDCHAPHGQAAARKAAGWVPRERVPDATCACGKAFRRRRPQQAWCTAACWLRAYGLPPRECAKAGCGKAFQPVRRGQRFCGLACRPLARDLAEPRKCAWPFCRRPPFRPARSSQACCRRLCRDRMRRAAAFCGLVEAGAVTVAEAARRTGWTKSQAAKIRRRFGIAPRPAAERKTARRLADRACVWCGTAFRPSKSSHTFCRRGCASAFGQASRKAAREAKGKAEPPRGFS